MWQAGEPCQTCAPKAILHMQDVKQDYICLFDDTSSHFGWMSLLISHVCSKLSKTLRLQSLESSMIPQLQGQNIQRFKLK